MADQHMEYLSSRILMAPLLCRNTVCIKISLVEGFGGLQGPLRWESLLLDARLESDSIKPVVRKAMRMTGVFARLQITFAIIMCQRAIWQLKNRHP